MTIEEKAKAYDEALNRAKKELDACGSQDCDAAKQIFRFFQELRESEDEKIRKALISFLKSPFVNENITDEKVTPWIAWLEKQGEQKPIVEMKSPEESLGIDSDTYNKIVDECIYGDDEQKPAWNEEDEAHLTDILCKVKDDLILNKDEKDWLKSLKDRVLPQPKQEWSEEDNQYLCGLIGLVEQSKAGLPITLKGKAADNCIDWLNSLRPQSHWKPSDEQIKALESATENCAYSEYQDCLRELIEQLKK